jgi:hypothetical protein
MPISSNQGATELSLFPKSSLPNPLSLSGCLLQVMLAVSPPRASSGKTAFSCSHLVNLHLFPHLKPNCNILWDKNFFF